MNGLEEILISLIPEDACRIVPQGAGIFRFPAAYRYQMHRHPEIEINYINSGKCMMQMDRKWISMKQGSCILIYPEASHCFLVDAREQCRITQLIFRVEFPDPSKLPNRFRFFTPGHPWYRFDSCETICRTLENIGRMYRDNSAVPEKKLIQKLEFLQLFLSFSEKIEEQENQRKSTSQDRSGSQTNAMQNILNIQTYLNENFDSDFSIETLGRTYGLSSRYVRKKFRELTGMSCRKYVTMLRIAKARALLWETEKSITEIAMQTGFNSAQYFCRVFQEYTGMTPGEYRNFQK